MRPYRWQDPAPAPVGMIRERRTKRVPINCAQTAPEQPSMVVDGVEYIEAQGDGGTCIGCAFEIEGGPACVRSSPAKSAFGGDCQERDVIYLRKA